MNADQLQEAVEKAKLMAEFKGELDGILKKYLLDENHKERTMAIAEPIIEILLMRGFKLMHSLNAAILDANKEKEKGGFAE